MVLLFGPTEEYAAREIPAVRGADTLRPSQTRRCGVHSGDRR